MLYLPIGQSPLIPHVAVGIKIAANMPLLKIAYKEVTCFFSSKIKSLRVHQIAHIRAVAPQKSIIYLFGLCQLSSVQAYEILT